jgi:putative endonuclease
LRTFEREPREEALRLEARIKKLKRPQKELLVTGGSAIEGELRAGLGERLKPKKKRRKKRV